MGIGAGAAEQRPAAPFVSRTVRLMPHAGGAQETPPGVLAVLAQRREVAMAAPAPGSYDLDKEGEGRRRVVEAGSVVSLVSCYECAAIECLGFRQATMLVTFSIFFPPILVVLPPHSCSRLLALLFSPRPRPTRTARPSTS